MSEKTCVVSGGALNGRKDLPQALSTGVDKGCSGTEEGDLVVWL